MKHNMFIFILLITITQLQYNLGLQYDFHGPNGPQTWAQKWSSCGGSEQSPIDIVSPDAQLNENVSTLSFTGFDQNVSKINLTNENSKVGFHLIPSGDNVPKVTGGFLNGTYNFKSVYFNWGPNNSMGSEHALNGKKYPMEINFVFIKDGYNTLEEAANDTEGIAIFSKFVTISLFRNNYYESIIKALSSIKKHGQSTILNYTGYILHFIPGLGGLYFFYKGSATVPACQPELRFVLNDHISLSSRQVAAFRNLHDQHGDKISVNYRPIQPLNGRVVQYSNKITIV